MRVIAGKNRGQSSFSHFRFRISANETGEGLRTSRETGKKKKKREEGEEVMINQTYVRNCARPDSRNICATKISREFLTKRAERARSRDEAPPEGGDASAIRSHASRSHTPAATWPAAVARASNATTEKRSIVHSVVRSNSKFNNKGNRTPR